MRGRALVLVCAVVLWRLAYPVSAGEVVLYDVPGYLWRGGCGPTAAGMIIGYWDAHGFSDLISAGDGTNSWQTNQQVVKDMIASPGYYDDYWSTPDRSPPPEYHLDDCVADFMECSRDPLGQGLSYAYKQDDGLVGYMAYCGYDGATSGWMWHDIHDPDRLWDRLVEEIDAGRPMEFFVDVSSDGVADHFVTAIGYDDTSGTRQYACYNTYGINVQWYDFALPGAGCGYGISTGTWFDPGEAPLTAGDADCNGTVNNDDVSVLMNNWLMPAYAQWSDGDFDDDGDVDLNDLSALAVNWQGVSDDGAGNISSSSQAAIPEPAALTLLLWGAAAGVGTLSRRK